MHFNIIFSLAFFVLVFIGVFVSGKLLIISFSWFNKKRKIFVYASIALVILLFFLSFSLLNNFQHNLLALFYIISAVLFALLSQLMLFGLLYYLISLFLKKKRWKKLTAQGLLILSSLFFILGIYNAFNARVKTVSLDNFNIEKKIVHLSDLHLGHIHGPTYLNRLVSQVNDLNADLIIISGDLFDGNDKEIDKFIEPLKEFKAPTIFVFGNHDVYIFQEDVRRVIEEAGLIELSDKALVISDLEIIGFNYMSHEDSNIRRGIESLLPEKLSPRIVVNHVPVDYKEAHALEADLMLAGHTHRGQVFPISIITKLIYGKYAYGLSNYLDMLVYTSAGLGTWGPPIRTPFRGEIVLFELN